MDVGAKAEAKIAEHEARIKGHEDEIKEHKAAISVLESDVARLRSFLLTYRELASGETASVERMVADAKRNGATVAFVLEAPTSRVKGKRGPNGSPPDEIAKATEEIVREAGKPLTRSALIPLIEAKGLTIGGNDKAKNLGTLLWRSGMFTSTGEGYWPKDRALPSGRFPGAEPLRH